MLGNKNADLKWKTKYLDLLDQYEAVEQKLNARDDLFAKSVKRLVIAAKGLDANIDRALDDVASAVAHGIKVAYLELALENLTKACMQHDFEYAKPTLNADLLLEFLAGFAEEPATLTRLKTLEQRYQADGFSSQEELFKALDQAMPLTLANQGNSAEASETKTGLNDSQTAAMVARAVAGLLEKLPIPVAYDMDRQEYLDRLRRSKSPEGLNELLEECADFLLKVKNQVENEQQDLQTFFTQLTEQLAELSQTALGATSKITDSSERDQAWDQSFNNQVRDLQADSAQAQSLSDLKNLVNNRLQLLAEELETRRQQEASEHSSLRGQLQAMGDKVKKMEAESADLKTKLTLAYDKAVHDPLTGLANRIAYEERFRYEVSRWQRYQTPLAIIVCDIDFFKKINDTFGHKAGDKTLKIIAGLLRESCRQTDFVARFGGEEFVLLLPETTRESALNLAEKLRLRVEKARFSGGGKPIRITLSCGVSEFLEGDDAEAVFERADQALYQAKNQGRNRCVVS